MCIHSQTPHILVGTGKKKHQKLLLAPMSFELFKLKPRTNLAPKPVVGAPSCSPDAPTSAAVKESQSALLTVQRGSAALLVGGRVPRARAGRGGSSFRAHSARSPGRWVPLACHGCWIPSSSSQSVLFSFWNGYLPTFWRADAEPLRIILFSVIAKASEV